MFNRIRSRLQAWRTQQRLRREVMPRVFLRLTDEIADLARCAAISCRDDTRVRTMFGDLDELRQQATSPSFAKLSVERRLLLRQGLIQSRQQLIDSLQSAARPTRFLH
ncbi:MAG: hypothetical protein KKB70_09040 [Proteobacteria bacterium]|nr:hypothetical protein [Pseudomonadota bacterium]MBU1612755.1 hypothetical protein [Pseudomonadota bacterium]